VPNPTKNSVLEQQVQDGLAACLQITRHVPDEYVELGEAFRGDAGRPKQRTVASLGRLDQIHTEATQSFFAHGFFRVRCDDYGHDYFVAYSCKGRGVCPVCNARGMVEAGDHRNSQKLYLQLSAAAAHLTYECSAWTTAKRPLRAYTLEHCNR
jgi:hypothetical protein